MTESADQWAGPKQVKDTSVEQSDCVLSNDGQSWWVFVSNKLDNFIVVFSQESNECGVTVVNKWGQTEFMDNEELKQDLSQFWFMLHGQKFMIFGVL